MGNGSISIKLQFDVKARIKILINDDKPFKDQLHFVERPGSENGLFTIEYLESPKGKWTLKTYPNLVTLKTQESRVMVYCCNTNIFKSNVGKIIKYKRSRFLGS